MKGAVYVAGDSRPIATLPALEIPATRVRRDPLKLDKRIHYILQAGVLITIPRTNDALKLRSFDVVAALKESGIDYLFVQSIPPAKTHRGALYRYRIETRSLAGGVRYKLEGAPAGMTISLAGLISWQVPEDFEQEEVAVIVLISDKSGQERFHTFRIRIQPPAE